METRQAIRSFLLDREARNRSPETIDWYRRKLKPFAEMYEELPEEPTPIREFMRDLAGLADVTKHGYYRALQALYNFVHLEWGFPLDREVKNLEANPIRKVGAPVVRPKAMRSLSLEGLHRLLSASHDSRERKWALRDRVILGLFSDTGARLGEIASLTWPNVNDETIYVTGKTGEQEKPLSPELRLLLTSLRRWNDANFGPSDHVFLGKRGTPLTKQGVQEVVERWFKRAGFTGPRCSPHTLRHTFGRNWIAEGGDQFTLQRILGHTTMQMVQRYVDMNLKETIRQHRRFSPFRTQARMAQGSLLEEATV
jgi:integrase